MSTTDSVDEKLIILLGQDARQNSKKLAKQLNISSATVRRRLRSLINSGSLHIIGVVNPSKFGLPLTAIIALDVDQRYLGKALESLIEKPEITWVSTTTGRYDIIARGSFVSTDSLSNFLTEHMAMIGGVKNSETFICLDVRKGRRIPFPKL